MASEAALESVVVALPADDGGPDSLTAAFDHKLALSTRGVHADDYVNSHRAVAPPMHVSTTFRYSKKPEELRPAPDFNVDPNAPYDTHIYSRHTAPNSSRIEALLTSLLGAPSITYSSGLAAFHALLVFLNPRRIAISGGYHGCHGVISLLSKLSGLKQLDLFSESDIAQLQKGDVIHVETPLNPTGEARDLAYWRTVADEKECYLTVDGTFGPPPLQDPFKFGVDAVMHSGTKYFGGHSDMLCGVVAVRPDRSEKEGWAAKLREERLFLGSVLGNMEGWLGVRSLRTLELRVLRQSESADKLVGWLAAATKQADPPSPAAQLVDRVFHASQQPEAADADSWLRKQMPNGFGPVFSVTLRSERAARNLPSKLHLFHHATSLGGVESLVEWRAMSDTTVDRRLLRFSIGVEAWEDLRADLENGFKALLEDESKANSELAKEA